MRAIESFLGFFQDVSYQLLRYSDYEAFDRFGALLTELPWPPFGEGFKAAEHPIGAVVRADGSVLLYLVDDPVTVYLESTDLGLSYHAFDGPGGARGARRR